MNDPVTHHTHLSCTVCISVLFILLFITTFETNAQPGGGGGLDIRGIYNSALQPIPMNDSSLHVRLFRLEDSSTKADIAREIYVDDPRMSIPMRYNEHNHIRSVVLPPNKSRFFQASSLHLPNQRMLALYKGDTMIVDFIGVWSENGGGLVDIMDSLVLQNGYFRYNRSLIEESFMIMAREQRELHRAGLTPHSLPALISLGAVRKAERADISFLDEANLAAEYYLGRGEHYLYTERYKQAANDILHALAKGLTFTDSISAFALLCETYTQSAQYRKAIEAITELIEIEYPLRRMEYSEEPESLIRGYHVRAELFITTGELQRALSDYDSIVAVSTYKNRPVVKRAAFKMDYLQDCVGALHDLKTLADVIIRENVEGLYSAVRQYGDLCFPMAEAEYCLGRYEKAFDLFLQGAEWGRVWTRFDPRLLRLDSLVQQQHPNAPELVLARAMLSVGAMRYSSGESKQNLLDTILVDLENVERMGLDDYRINKYRAIALQNRREYKSALSQINIAIQKQRADPHLYSLRYDIRKRLGQVVSGDKSDADIMQQKKLVKSWNPLKLYGVEH